MAATIVPDEAAWAVWGHDLAAAGFTAAVSPERATALLVCDPLPEPLTAAVRDAWSRMPGRRVLVPLPADLQGSSPQEVVRDAGMDHGEHAGMDHGEHAGMDHGEHAGHGDMMAIVGEPSADGLVMEDLAMRLGPLSPVLPGGLVADLTLDGDVVAAADLQATLHVPLADAAAEVLPDPLCPQAWRAALAGARGEPWPSGIAAVELERVRSHAAWLRTLGRAVGATELIDLAGTLLDRAQTADSARSACERAERLIAGRRLRQRLEGRGVVVEADGLRGPNARAAGRPQDARSGDPRYAKLGFAPVVAQGGDALARCEVRLGEIAQSLELVRGDAESADTAGPALVEGPRGPLRALRTAAGLAVAAPGSADGLAAAAQAITGLELASAVAVLVSFDLSPWRVGP